MKVLIFLIFYNVPMYFAAPGSSPMWQNLVRAAHLGPCVRCSTRKAETEAGLSEPQLTDLRVELIKQQILEKLRLSEAPNITLPREAIPRPIVNATVLRSTVNLYPKPSSDIDDFYGKTEQVILFPTGDVTECGDDICFALQVPNHLSYSMLNGAILWLHAKYPSQIAVSQMHSSTDGSLTIAHAEAEGWMQISLLSTLTQWLNTNGHGKRRFLTLRVSNNNCSSADCSAPISTRSEFKPFLAITTRNTYKARRTKRNVNCSPGVKECCRENLHVSFQDIGWSDWILHPKGYDAYFCRGSCTNAASVTQSSSFYTSVIQRYVHQGAHLQHRKLDLAPCCTPTKLSPLQLLYMDENMMVMQKTLPNMVVEACGCL